MSERGRAAMASRAASPVRSVGRGHWVGWAMAWVAPQGVSWVLLRVLGDGHIALLYFEILTQFYCSSVFLTLIADNSLAVRIALRELCISPYWLPDEGLMRENPSRWVLLYSTTYCWGNFSEDGVCLFFFF